MLRLTLILITLVVLSCKEEQHKQFTQISGEASGITFSNTITETDSLNYFTYPYMYMGGGVSAGDINNDGLEDLFFTGNMRANALYLNQGDITFKDITETAGVAGDERWFTGSTMVDINNDGYLDIYVSVSGKGDLRNNLLYVNNGDLTFTESATAYGIAHNGHTTQSSFFDYDRDGDLDLYIANYPPTPFKSPVELYAQKAQFPKLEESDILYRNNGDNTFTDVTKAAGILNFGLTLSATAGDMNQDGWPDLYVSNDFDSADYMYINNQDGTFSEVSKITLKHTAQYGMGSDIADYNNDSFIDIAQVDMTPEDNRRSKANMASMNPFGFQKMVDAGLHYQYMQNCLQLHRGVDEKGLPIYSEVARLAGVATTDWSWSVLFADLDNDGWKDIAISNGTRRDINNRDYFNTLKARNHFGGVSLTAEEIDKIPSEKVANYVYKNNGDLTFTNKVEAWGWDEKTFSNGATYTDLDNDGDLDMVVNNIDQPVSILRNNNLEKNNYIKIRFDGPAKNKNGLGTKVYLTSEKGEQYQELTLTRGFQSSVAPVVHFGVGQETSIVQLKVIWPDGSSEVLQDVEVNEEVLFAFAKAEKSPPLPPFSPTSNIIFKNTALAETNIDFTHSENPYNDYAREPLLPYETSKLGPNVSVADVNGDGLDDFYVGGASGQAAALYVQQEDGTFITTNEDVWQLDAVHEDMHGLFFDADGDNDNDLYVVSGGNEVTNNKAFFQDRLYINDGEGNFKKDGNALPTITSSGSKVIAGDYDNDGDADLFVGGRLVAGQYPWPAKSYVLENTNGTFTDVTASNAPDFEQLGMVTDALWTDVDQDGNLDLMIVGEWMSITFYKNEDTSFTKMTIAGLENSAGWWSSLAQEDFDNDGDMDYVVGNLGLNYKYKATTTEPFEVFADDFDNNNRKDIVLSYYNFGKLFPLRGRSCSAQQIPGLKKKFEDYSSFAIADVSSVYGKEELKNAEIHYKAHTFASSFIENKGDGKFVITKLPNEAQLSSVNAILARDMDGDGYKDLVLGGNLYTSEIETPRNDSSVGTFLKGNGDGSFASIPNSKSNLYLSGDVKDITPITISESNYLLAVRNNDTPQLIKINKEYPTTTNSIALTKTTWQSRTTRQSKDINSVMN